MFKKFFLTACFLLPLNAAISLESNLEKDIVIESNGEFSFLNNEQVTLKLKPLKDELRSVQSLSSADAVGVVHLGKISLNEPSSALGALRAIATQISRSINLDMALITDSNTSSQMAPNELLLMYHPQIVITLALTRSVSSDQFDVIGTYAITSKPQNIESKKSETEQGS